CPDYTGPAFRTDFCPNHHRQDFSLLHLNQARTHLQIINNKNMKKDRREKDRRASRFSTDTAAFLIFFVVIIL
ncbi:MAG: hypothetical protein ACOYB8_11110, partial [Eubacteriaceae bacterium]